MNGFQTEIGSAVVEAPKPAQVTPARDPSMDGLLAKIDSFLNDERSVPNGSRDALRDVAAGTVDVKMEKPVPEKQPAIGINEGLTNNEKKYVEENRTKMPGLETKYVDERTEASYIQKQIETFAEKSGLKHEDISELVGKTYDQESQKIISDRIQSTTDRLLNSEQGRLNPEKQKIVAEQTRRYLELISQAQTEGDLPKDISAQTVLRLVEDNVWTLAYQDRIASENMIGDHGIRHIVGYNIRICEEIDNELVRNGQRVRAVDRLIQHQAMINHDLGYASDPVRQAINKGSFSEDRGHNVLSAKYFREKSALSNDPLTQVFSTEQLQTIHEGILKHDSSEIDFHIGETSEAALRENVLSAIHIADNTHAFEDKLPEILYTYPDTLRIIRLMKTAGEIGDVNMISTLQAQLVEGIQGNTSFSKDDKEALTHAAQSLNAESYKFSVGRICGNKPEVTIDKKGDVIITVQESAIHQEIIGLYGQDSYDQLRKFIADLTGKDKKEVNLDQDKIESADGRIQIVAKIGKERANEQELTDYQQRVENLIADSVFQEFIIGNGAENMGDSLLGVFQSNLQQELKNLNEGTDMYSRVAERIEQIKLERKSNLQHYLLQYH